MRPARAIAPAASQDALRLVACEQFAPETLTRLLFEIPHSRVSTIDDEIRRSACPLTSTLTQLQPVLGQTKPKRSIIGVLSQSSQSAAFPRLFVEEAKQISVAPSCWPTFLGMGYLTTPAFERIQVGQSPKPWRSARKAHRLSATVATWRNRPSIVGTISRHV
jgi:hypothetical protein